MRPMAMRLMLAALAVLALVGCTPPPAEGGATIRVVAVAGPTCPVVSDPPDPACADRPVEGASIAVLDEGGSEVARLVTDAAGEASAELPPGRYRLEPQPVDGLMGTAEGVELAVADGVDPAPVTIAYDTGIR